MYVYLEKLPLYIGGHIQVENLKFDNNYSTSKGLEPQRISDNND
jgi:hypothetical protein